MVSGATRRRGTCLGLYASAVLLSPALVAAVTLTGFTVATIPAESLATWFAPDREETQSAVAVGSVDAGEISWHTMGESRPTAALPNEHYGE